MKHISKKLFVYTLLLSILVVFSASFLAYRIGYVYGRRLTLSTLKGDLVMSLTVLPDIRNNNILKGVEVLEAYCYCTACCLLDDTEWSNDDTVKIFIPELIEYRKKFAVPQSQWTVMEKRLEELLAQWKLKEK